MELEFIRPAYLYFLLLIPLFIVVHFLSLRSKHGQALTFSNFEALARIKGVDIYSKNLSLLVFSCIIALLLIFSLAGLTIHMTARTSQFSFVVAIDSSQSMEATDLSPSRLEAAKSAATSFIRDSGVGTRIGVVSFSGNTLIHHVVSEDKSAVITGLDHISISDVGGTDIYEAVVTSVNMLIDEKRRSLILFSDGQLNVGNIDDSISYAREHDVTIHSISLGTIEGGETSYGVSKLDEDSLKALAYNTGGTYNSIQDTSSLDDLVKGIADIKLGSVSLLLTPYLTVIALLLLMVLFVLSDYRYRLF